MALVRPVELLFFRYMTREHGLGYSIVTKSRYVWQMVV